MRNITLSIVLFSFCSCSNYLTPFSSDVEKDAALSTEQLKQIQFYNSSDIVLYRNLTNAEAEISQGKLKVVKGQNIEEIIIKSGTPGIVISKEENGSLLVSFDDDGSYLRFGPNYGYGGRYTLMAKNWEGKNGLVQYGNKEYQTSAQSSFSYLMIDMSKINNTNIQSREATGKSLHP